MNRLRNVLILDAHLRHSLTIARSLSVRGIRVIAASHKRRFPAAYSRHVSATVQLPEDPDAAALEAAIAGHRAGVVIAGGLAGQELLCRHRRELENLVRAPFNDLETFHRLSNKQRTLDLAAELGVPVPRSVAVRDARDAEAVAEEVGFPLVFKSSVDQGTVRYARNMTELDQLVSEFHREQADHGDAGPLPLVQEYIPGEAHGFYGLADHGRLSAYFMHRRLHEMPPSGGPSAMAMSFRDPTLLELGQRFFTATSWHGVAMVEFKRSRRDGSYYLLEVNPKFWGSLALSVAAGVDFPWLLYGLLTGSPRDHELGDYADETIFRWLTMDLAYAASSGRIRQYFRTFLDDRIADDYDASDPLPTLALFVSGFPRILPPVAATVGGGAATAIGSAPFDRPTSDSEALERDGSPANGSAGSRSLQVFYRLKPLLPRKAQIAARRVRAQRIWRGLGCDPVPPLPSDPLGYRWPEGRRACVLITHDVETAVGQRNVGRLAELERSYDVRSCWNFVVHRYDVDTGLIEELKDGGHEIGVHGVYHDGREFASAAEFRRRMEVVVGAARAWGANGYRSPSLLFDLGLLRELPMLWDSSMPAWDPFQPKPGDCGSYVPFALTNGCVELPVTLWQDFTLLEELRLGAIDVWRVQADAIYSAGGLITVIVHPDYMLSPEHLGHYEALLKHVTSLDDAWIATPSEVARWHQRQVA